MVLNPNVIISILFLILCPNLLLIDFIEKKNNILRLYNHIELQLHKKTILIPFLIIETLIWLHNIISDV